MKTKEDLIKKHLENWHGLGLSSIENFAKTGKASGTFFTALKDMLDEHSDQFKLPLVTDGEIEADADIEFPDQFDEYSAYCRGAKAMRDYLQSSEEPKVDPVLFVEWVENKKFKRIDWNGKWIGGNLSEAQTTSRLKDIYKETLNK